jgi:hypothetical protein
MVAGQGCSGWSGLVAITLYALKIAVNNKDSQRFTKIRKETK